MIINSRPVAAALEALLVLSVAACGAKSGPLPLSRETDEERARQSALTVIEGDRLQAAIESGATIPEILSTRVPSLRKVYASNLATECPVFVLRGNASITQITVPDIYVDNSRANDSCVLYTLVAQQLRAIEVYASGAAPVGIAMRANTGGAIVLRTKVAH